MRTGRLLIVSHSLLPGGCLLPGGVCPGGVCSGGPAWGVVSQHAQVDTPPWTESHTSVKTLPWPNFVAAGKNQINLELIKIIQFCLKICNLLKHPHLWVGVWVEWWVNRWVNGQGSGQITKNQINLELIEKIKRQCNTVWVHKLADIVTSLLFMNWALSQRKRDTCI